MKRLKNIWKNYHWAWVLFLGISIFGFYKKDWLFGGVFFMIAMFALPEFDFENEE